MRNNLVYILPLILFSLVAAIWAGWLRLGFQIPLTKAAAQHGALMVNSFLASLIFLDRAVTFKQKWVLVLPFLNAISGIFFVAGFPQFSSYLLNIGGFGFAVMCFYFLIRYKEFYYFIFLIGAICLFAGNIILQLKQTHSFAVPWWMAFLLFTIVAERLELTRFLNLTSFKKNLLTSGLALVPLSLLWPGEGSNYIMAIACAFIAVWLMRYDMARHAVKRAGSHRYSGLLLLTGYVWLLITAIFLVVGTSLPFGYDAALHSFFIGFVFSMIFSHAPIILPAVARLPVKLYRPVLYVWFALLQLSLIFRMFGDVSGSIALRKAGGGVNGVVILGFFITVAGIVKSELSKLKRLRKA